jgi:beta-N-acetylhexosaminidase
VLTRRSLLAALVLAGAATLAAQTPLSDTLDRSAAKWVDDTLKKMTLDEKIGQLIVPSFNSTYLASDTDEFEVLARKVADLHVGGFHVFGGTEPVPGVLLNANYGSVILGQPFAAASLVNRLQSKASVPLLNTADFEAGVGFRISGATTFPRAMAVAAAADEALAFEAARITAVESRALGIHVNFAPVADVNNNARNPVINTRSFGESPEVVGRLAAAYVRGLHAGGMLATLKHFPGHGDTDVDSHIGLPIIQQPRERLERVELPPFAAGIGAGADAIMTAHIQLPALDTAEFSPASLSRPIVGGLLRGEMKFEGLIYTDSMSMDAVSRRLSPGAAAVRALQAGNDVILHSPDDFAAADGIKAAVARGDVPLAQLEASVRRVLTAKARLGLHKTKIAPLDDIPSRVGGRTHATVAQALSQKSITLIKDVRQQVPLRLARTASILYLSLLDYPSNWRIAAPSRTFVPELRKRWPSVTPIELSDRSRQDEIDLVRTTAGRYDAVVASVFVRAASSSGRMDLSPPLAKLLSDLARSTGAAEKPFVTVFFGNPYVPMSVPDVPAMLLTYDFYDLAEASAVRAIAGEARITGRLPIALPGMFELGAGILR